VNGGTVNGVGDFTATCSGAEDNAGNTGSASVAYHVHYADVSGFLQPINPDNSSVFKRGQSVPAKLRIGGDEPYGFDTSAWIIKRISVACDVAAEDGVAESVASNTPSTTFRYDASADQYIYNADFRSVSTGTCWRLRATLDDGSIVNSAVFKIAK